MELNLQLVDALNAQMNAEMVNHLTYNAIAGALNTQNWPGFSEWMRRAATDEWAHSKKFEEFLIDRNQIPHYAQNFPIIMVAQVPVIEYFRQALGLERENTIAINKLNALAEEADDPQTESWIIWAINEQTRSERELLDAIMEIERTDPGGLLILDREYGNKE